MKKRAIGKIGVLVILGIFILTGLSTAVFAWDWDNNGNEPGGNDFLGTTTDTDLRIKTYGQQRMVVKADGKIGIGTASPQQMLTLGSGSNFATELSPPTGVDGESVGGGNFPTGDYSYKVVALDGAGGESTWSVQHTQWVNNSLGEDAVELTWSPVIGAVSYNVYGRTGDAQDKFWNVPSTYFLDEDIWNAGTSGTPPDITDAYVNKLTAAGNSWINGGNVGIGTASPDTLLDIEKQGTSKSNLDIFHITNTVNSGDMDGTKTSILFNQYYYDPVTPAVADIGRITVGTESDWTSTASYQDGYMAFYTVADGTLNERMRITSNGRVGIGTINPTAKIQLREDTNDNVIAFSDDSDTPEFVMGVDATDSNFKIHSGSALIDASDFIITSAGNIGIGISPGDYKLNVDGSAKIDNMLEVAAGGGGIQFNNEAVLTTAFNMMTIYLNTDNSGVGQGEFSIHRYTDEMVRFEFSSGNSWIYPAGNFGIGTVTPANKLTVLGNADFTGNVGIGTPSPGSKLSVVGLPSSAATLNSGDLYTQTGTQLWGSGTVKVICIV